MHEEIVNPLEKRSTVVDVEAMNWQVTDIAGIQMKLLCSGDQGRSTKTFKMELGSTTPLRKYLAIERTYVFEGSLEDDDGECSAGNLVWRPRGNMHVVHSPKSAVILSVFNKPNRFVDGMQIFTADADENRYFI